MDANESAGRIIADAGQGLSGGMWNMLMSALGKVSKPIADFAKRQRRGAMGDMLMKTDEAAESFLRNLDAMPPIIGYQLPRLAAPAAVGVNSLSPLLPEPTATDPLIRR